MGGPLGWSGSWRWVLGASPVSALSRLWNPVSLSSWCPAAVFPGRQDSTCSQNPELLFISKRALEAPMESIFKDHFHTSRVGDSESHGGGMEGLPGFT